MFETIVDILTQVPWYWVLVIAFATTFVENIFPPSPGDSILLFTGTLMGLGVVGFPELLLASSIGSSLGFAVMYQIGFKFDKAVMNSGKFKFISRDALIKVEGWFQKYGYKVIVVNRFLSGTRAVISFFAGMSKLNFWHTITLATISSLIWNSLIIYLGSKFGNNWQTIDYYMSLYGKIIFPIVILIVLFFVVKWILSMRKAKS
jgi:membrane protein DedA with SNARE-associated domain